MHPILFRIGSLEIHWYGFLIAVGFIAASWLFRSRAEKLGIPERDATNLMMLMLVSGIVGARLYYVVWNWDRNFGGEPSFAHDPLAILNIRKGGIVFYGGFLAANAVLWLWSRWKKLSFLELADALVPPLVLGHIFGRLGCFMQGCCYGKACDHFWGVHPAEPPILDGVPYFGAIHPTQLYEVVGLINILATLLVIEKLQRYPGRIILSYCLLYSLWRFIVEFYRGDVAHDILGRFTLAQSICIVLFIFAWLTSARLSYRAAVDRRKAVLSDIRRLQAEADAGGAEKK